MSRAAERELERLGEAHDREDDPAEQKALRDEMREIERELADEDRWREQGHERGWS